VLAAAFIGANLLASGPMRVLMKARKNHAAYRQGRRGNPSRASARTQSANAPARWLPRARISFQKCEVLFWLAYFLLPAFTGWLDYRPLPHEHYDPQRHELLSFHIREGWPNGLGSYEVPESWRDEKSGERYSAMLFSEHRQSEARRLGITCFAYGLAGCTFFACSRVARKKNTFRKSFVRALMVDVAVSIFVFLVT
jgi:hypothetical protein